MIPLNTKPAELTLARLGMPRHSEWIRVASHGLITPSGPLWVTVDSPAGSRVEDRQESGLRELFEGYAVELFGQVVPAMGDVDAHPYITSRYRLGETLTAIVMETWYGRLFIADQDIEAEAVWTPAGTRVAITRAGPRWSGRALAGAGRAAYLLQEYTQPPGGMTDAEAFDEAVRLGAEWLVDHPTKSPRDLRCSHLAARKVIEEKSYATWMTSKHFGIKDVRAKLVKLDGEK